MKNTFSYFTVCFLLCFLSVVPVLLVSTPPLADYVNHLARIHVLVNWDSSQFLQEYYTIEWAALPNMAMDLILPSVVPHLGLEPSAKIFTVLTLLVLAGGTLYLHFTLHERLSFYPFILFFFLYNSNFLFGFLNYLFSVGVFLFLFAYWIRLRASSWGLRLLTFGVAIAVLYHLHLYGLALYGVVVCSYELSRSWQGLRRGEGFSFKDWSVTLGQFLPVPIIFFFFSSTPGLMQDTTMYNIIDIGHYLQKLRILFEIFDNYQFELDILTALLLTLLLVLGVVLRRIVFAPNTLLPLCILSVLFLVMPRTVFGSWAADGKFSIAIALFCVAATDWRLRSQMLRRALVVSLLALFALRMAVISETWLRYDQDYAQYRSIINDLPEGTKLSAAIARDDDREKIRPVLEHIWNYVIIDRDGFFPTFFATVGKQPVNLAAPYQALQEQYGSLEFFPRHMNQEYLTTERTPFLPELLAQYDYMIIINEEKFGVALPEILVLDRKWKNLSLYRVEKAS